MTNVSSTSLFCSLPNSEPFYGGDLALIHESLTANFPRESGTLESKIQSRENRISKSKFFSRIRDFAIQNPVSGIQNFKEVLDLPYMKLGGRVCKSFLIHTMSYIPNLFSALCQSAFFIAWSTWLLSGCSRQLLLCFVKFSS